MKIDAKNIAKTTIQTPLVKKMAFGFGLGTSNLIPTPSALCSAPFRSDSPDWNYTVLYTVHSVLKIRSGGIQSGMRISGGCGSSTRVVTGGVERGLRREKARVTHVATHPNRSHIVFLSAIRVFVARSQDLRETISNWSMICSTTIVSSLVVGAR